jgi:ParB family chromosome partitioning protein
MAEDATRSRLGRGLAALIGDVGTESSAERPRGQRRLPTGALRPNTRNPRRIFSDAELDELVASLRERGIIQPIIARSVRGAADSYEIIAGERRWRAAQMAGLGEIPAVIREVADEAAVAMALIENIQRENLNPLEEARALSRLIEEFGLTHQAAAAAVGRSRAAVSNLLRLMELADEVKELLELRSIEMGHARALLGLSARRQQIEVALLVAKKGLSVRDTEALVRRLLNPPQGHSQGEDPVDPDIRRLEMELADKLGAKVAFQHSPSGKGKLVVSYNTLDELEGILAHIT